MKRETATITYRGKRYARTEFPLDRQRLEVSAQLPTGDLDPWNYCWRRSVDLVDLCDEGGGQAGRAVNVAPRVRAFRRYRPGRDVSGWGSTLRELAAAFDRAYDGTAAGGVWSGTIPGRYELWLWMDGDPILTLGPRDRIVVTPPDERTGGRHVYFDEYLGEENGAGQ